MKKHLKYLSYVIRHKWFVFKACRWMRVPLWQAVIHDWSKFLPSEWFPYVNYFYGKKPPQPDKDEPDDFRYWCSKAEWDSFQERFDRAWLHHQHSNPHHWQHWVLREDSGAIKLLEMPDRFAREMVADWIGAGRAITGKYEAFAWYQNNKDKIQLHPLTKDRVDRIIGDWENCRLRMIRVLGHYYL